MAHLNINHKVDRIDPVCGLEVSSMNDDITAVLNNHTYYFCTENCREEFEKSPDSYVKEKTFFLKTWFNNYLKRMKKITGGKPPDCCG